MVLISHLPWDHLDVPSLRALGADTPIVVPAAAEALRLIRPRAAVPIHWGTYWPHTLGRVLPERLVEPPAAFAEYAAELAPKVRTLPTAVGDMVGWEG